MINRRFINFKTYDAFRAALEADPSEIDPKSIVFIQDKPCIWTHGKEYICDGPYTADAINNTLTFKNGKDSIVFSIYQKDGVIEFTDSNGIVNRAAYISKDIFDSTVATLQNKIQNVEQAIATAAFDDEELKHIVQQYLQDVSNKKDVIIVDESNFNTLQQNNELRADVCYLITD